MNLGKVLLACSLMLCVAQAANAQVHRTGATEVYVKNQSSTNVQVMVTVPNVQTNGAQSDGCPTGTIEGLRYLVVPGGQPQPLIKFSASPLGWFLVKPGQTVQLLNVGLNPVTRQVSSCFQGTLMGFNQIGNQCADVYNKFYATTPLPPNCPTATQAGGATYPFIPTSFPDPTPGPNFGQNINPPRCLPNGSNAFEFTLNLPGTIGGKTYYIVGGKTIPAPTQEAVDISCVNGANCKISVDITPPVGGPYWVTNLGPALGGFKTYSTTTTFGPNSWVDILRNRDDNCVDPKTGFARPGIYPYGCTQCNTPNDPAPPCVQSSAAVPVLPRSQFCYAKNGLPYNNGCGYSRNPPMPGVQKFGGSMTVNYFGPLAPPP